MGNTAFDEVIERTGLAAKWEQRGFEKATQQWQSKVADYQRQLDESRRKLAQYEAAVTK
jgi:uncharacterized protein YukE